MNNWQKDLLKKQKELDIKGGSKENITQKFQKKIILNNSKKGGRIVITVEAALSDLDALIKDAEKGEDKGIVYLLKAQKVLLKFMSTMRSNQLLTDVDKVKIAKAREARKSRETK